VARGGGSGVGGDGGDRLSGFERAGHGAVLLYHIPTDRYVVVELKAGKFKPEHLGQLNFYVSVVKDKIRLARQHPAAGILVCGSKNEHTVRYALDDAAQPSSVPMMVPRFSAACRFVSVRRVWPRASAVLMVCGLSEWRAGRRVGRGDRGRSAQQHLAC
jgi:hypothetical protein